MRLGQIACKNQYSGSLRHIGSTGGRYAGILNS